MKAFFATLLLLAAFATSAHAQVKDLNTPRSFPPIASKAEWKKHAEEIREHVLMSCGLWPMPPKTPLNAQVFDRVDRHGYSVEKVYFETYPGFFLAGNLYRPLGRGKGPFPAILNPHGHWENGRMADATNGSIAARCINQALQGMIAFSYDMAGYNDTRQVDHKFASNPTNLLWNISLMGLQTWNSIRALDFLEGLPDVNKKRLACTGESGGGTQTFMLGAIDDRLAMQAPIVMVSHSMQGGCLCENAPGLRVDYSNMEIAAVPAPRRQIIVAATGDWTKNTMEIEGPAIEHIYDLFKEKDRFEYAIFDYPHNYNRTTREAVYAALNKWLLLGNGSVPERYYKKEADADLRVFPNNLPEGALDETSLIGQMVRLYDEQERSMPRKVRETAWAHALQLHDVRFAGEDSRDAGTAIIRRQPDNVPVALNIHPGQGPVAIILAGDKILQDKLTASGITVVTTDACSSQPEADQFKNFFSSYNRTWVQTGAGNLKAVVQYLERRFPRSAVILIADARHAAPALGVAPLVDAVIADCSDLADADDSSLLRPNSFFPGIRRIGSFQGMLELADKKTLLLHGVSRNLRLDQVDGKKHRQRTDLATPDEIARFISTSIR